MPEMHDEMRARYVAQCGALAAAVQQLAAATQDLGELAQMVDLLMETANAATTIVVTAHACRRDREGCKTHG